MQVSSFVLQPFVPSASVGTMLSKLQKPDKRKRNDSVPALLPKLARLKAVNKSANDATVSAEGSSSRSSAPVPAEPATLRNVISDFFLANKLSGMDTHRLAAGGLQSGATGVSKIAAAGGQGSNPKNFARDIMREVLRGTPAPPLFWFPIPTWDAQTQSQVETSMPFLAIHQVLFQCMDNLNVGFNTNAMTPALRDEFLKACKELGVDSARTIALGLHGDGVPYSKKELLNMPLKLNL